MQFGASQAVANGIMDGYRTAKAHIGNDALAIKTKVQIEAEKEMQKEMERKAAEVERIMNAAHDKANTLARGEVGQQRAKLQEAGATQSQLMEFDAIQDIITHNQAAADLAEQRKKDAEELTNEMKELAEAAATVNMTEAEIMQRKLASLGATRQQLAEAERLSEVLAAGEAQQKFDDYMAEQQQALAKMQGSAEQLLRAELQKMGLVGAALEQALQQAMIMNSQIAQAEKEKAAQEDAIKQAEERRQGIEQTIADLRIKAAQLGMTNAQKVADDLRRQGASEGQIAEAIALQNAIDKFEASDPSNIADTTAGIDTALGNMKVGMPPEAFDAAMQTARLSEQQLEVLKEIEGLLASDAAATASEMSADMAVGAAAAIDAAKVGSNTIAGQAGAGTAIPAMDKVMTDLLNEEKRQTALLTTIANNTGAFAGALT